MTTAPAVAAPPKPAAAPPMELQYMPVEKVHPSPHNPRHDFPKEAMQQLAASIGLRGIEQPLKARRNKDGFELVFGHRRLKAAQLAGLKEVPVLVVAMTDVQVAESQLAENLDREDLAPLEVAGGYKRLLELGQSMDAVCERSGRKRTQVYAMMALLNLGPEGRKALGEGKVSTSVAQLVASYPKSVQDKALGIVEGSGHWSEPLTFRDARLALERELLVDLKKAPFDVKAEGIPCPSGAKSCAVCPKRAGNQPELFPDVKHGDYCTDAPWYREKLHADAKKTVEAKGWKLLTPKEAPPEEVFHNQGRGSVKTESGWLEPTEQCVDDAQVRPYKELLPTEQLKKLVRVALDADGKPRQLLERAGLLREVKRGGLFKPRKKAAPGAAAMKAAPEEQHLGDPARYRDPPPDINELVEEAFVEALVQAAEKKPLAQVAKMVAFELAGGRYELARRRGLKPGFLSGKDWERAFGKFKADKLAGLLFETGFGERFEAGDDMTEPAKALGVDRAKVEAAVKKANPIRWSEDKHGATGDGNKDSYLVGKRGKAFVFMKPKAAGALSFDTLEKAKAAAVKVETGLAVWATAEKKATPAETGNVGTGLHLVMRNGDGFELTSAGVDALKAGKYQNVAPRMRVLPGSNIAKTLIAAADASKGKLKLNLELRAKHEKGGGK